MDEDSYMLDEKSKTIAGLIEGLEIFAKHAKHGLNERWVISGEHDVVYFPGYPAADSQDGRRLNELGWHWDDCVDCWAMFA